MKILAILVFLVIVASLGTALFHLTKRTEDPEHSQKILKALTIRIALSVLLFILLFIAFAGGLIQPRGIGAGIQKTYLDNAAKQHQ